MDEVLTFCSVQDGTVELQRAPFYLSDIISNALKTIEGLCIERKIKLASIKEQAKPFRMYVADVQRLGNALVLLLENAARAAKEGSIIEISVHENDKESIVLPSIKKLRDTSIATERFGLSVGNLKDYLKRKNMKVLKSNTITPEGNDQVTRQPLNREPIEIRGGQVLSDVEVENKKLESDNLFPPVSSPRQSLSHSIRTKLKKVLRQSKIPVTNYSDITLTITYCKNGIVSDDEFYSAFSITMDTLRPEELSPKVSILY